MRKKWTQAEEDELRALYGTMTASVLAVRFGTTTKALYQKCFKLGLKKEQPNTIHLTSEQQRWMRLHYPHMATEICALILGISPKSVTRQARRLGLQKTELFMKECQAHMAKRAKESHLKNGTYPAKGYYSPNSQKGEPYRFKPGHKPVKPPF